MWDTPVASGEFQFLIYLRTVTLQRFWRERLAFVR